jgi:hypothetical protein
LKGGQQTVKLGPESFRTVEGDKTLKSWENVDLLGFRAYHETKAKMRIGSEKWVGPQPTFQKLYWVQK